ncbi:hypothetical protein EGR_06126 [Echinococcus granulosus]|uniref:Uncharacterized protein n=1 Tax=Echinococcus granulosus TaxID=6210 RepID=W6UCL1_ECHGR|nr:hypothetical protein EGR_06126 [Echinococcus granulosus]EUB59010.1 hypothetical protein EGR_06126 [Echinococcus granulosus]
MPSVTHSRNGDIIQPSNHSTNHSNVSAGQWNVPSPYCAVLEVVLEKMCGVGPEATLYIILYTHEPSNEDQAIVHIPFLRHQWNKLKFRYRFELFYFGYESPSSIPSRSGKQFLVMKNWRLTYQDLSVTWSSKYIQSQILSSSSSRISKLNTFFLHKITSFCMLTHELSFHPAYQSSHLILSSNVIFSTLSHYNKKSSFLCAFFSVGVGFYLWHWQSTSDGLCEGIIKHCSEIDEEYVSHICDAGGKGIDNYELHCNWICCDHRHETCPYFSLSSPESRPTLDLFDFLRGDFKFSAAAINLFFQFFIVFSRKCQSFVISVGYNQSLFSYLVSFLKNLLINKYNDPLKLLLFRFQ